MPARCLKANLSFAGIAHILAFLWKEFQILPMFFGGMKVHFPIFISRSNQTIQALLL